MAEKIDIEALTLAETIEIAKEVILGLPPSLTTPGALEFRWAVDRDMRAIIHHQCIPELPFD